MGRKRKSKEDAWMPPRLYRGRSAYELRTKDGNYSRVAPLTATPVQVLDKLVDVTADDQPRVERRYEVGPANYMVLYKTAKSRAKHYGMEFSLTPGDMEAMIERSGGRCEITRIAFHTKRTAGCRRAPYAPSLDRIHCELGYTAENTRLVCVAVNLALNEFGYDILLRISRRIVSEYTAKNKRSFRAVCR